MDPIEERLPAEVLSLIPKLLSAKNLYAETKPLQHLAKILETAPPIPRNSTTKPTNNTTSPTIDDIQVKAKPITHISHDSVFTVATQLRPKQTKIEMSETTLPCLSHQLISYLFNRRFGWSEGKNRWSWLIANSPNADKRRSKLHKKYDFEHQKKVINGCANSILKTLRRIMFGESWLDAVLYSVQVASNKPVVRQQAIAQLFDWLKEIKEFDKSNRKYACTENEFSRVHHIIILGLTDVWSATRKKSSLRLYGVLDILTLQQVCSIFNSLVHLASATVEKETEIKKSRNSLGRKFGTDSLGRKFGTDRTKEIRTQEIPMLATTSNTIQTKNIWGWKAIEGALLGITVIIKRFKRLQLLHSVQSGNNINFSPTPPSSPKTQKKQKTKTFSSGLSSISSYDSLSGNSSSSPQSRPQSYSRNECGHSQQILPGFVQENIRSVIYPLLRHSQLSVRENATRAFAAFLTRSPEDELLCAFDEILDQLRAPFKFATPRHQPLIRIETVELVSGDPNPKKALVEPDAEASGLGLLTAYESEGLLGLCVLLVKMIPASWFVTYIGKDHVQKTATSQENKKMHVQKSEEKNFTIDIDIVLNTLQRYLGHPASTVRQSCSAIFQHLVSKATPLNYTVESMSNTVTSSPMGHLNLIFCVLKKLSGEQNQRKKSPQKERIILQSQIDKDPRWSNRWEWKEGRLLAYELILQYILQNHRFCVFSFANSNECGNATSLSLDVSPNSTSNSAPNSSTTRKNNSFKMTNSYGNSPCPSPTSSPTGFTNTNDNRSPSCSPVSPQISALADPRTDMWPRPSPPPSQSPNRLRKFSMVSSDSMSTNTFTEENSFQSSLLCAIKSTESKESSLMTKTQSNIKNRKGIIDIGRKRSLSSECESVYECSGTFSILLNEMLAQTREALGTQRFEMQRIVAQVLPALTYVISWYDMDICTRLWKRCKHFVQTEDSVNAQMCARTIIATLKQTYYLQIHASRRKQKASEDLFQNLRERLPVIISAIEDIAGSNWRDGWVINLSIQMISLLIVLFGVNGSGYQRAIPSNIPKPHKDAFGILDPLDSKNLVELLLLRVEQLNEDVRNYANEKDKLSSLQDTSQRSKLHLDKSISRKLAVLLPSFIMHLECSQSFLLLPTILRWLRTLHADVESRVSLLEAVQKIFILPLKVCIRETYPEDQVENKSSIASTSDVSATRISTPIIPHSRKAVSLRVDTKAESEFIRKLRSLKEIEDTRLRLDVIKVAKNGTLLQSCEQCVNALTMILVKDTSTEASVYRQLLSILQTICVLVPDLRFGEQIFKALVDSIKQTGQIDDENHQTSESKTYKTIEEDEISMQSNDVCRRRDRRCNHRVETNIDPSVSQSNSAEDVSSSLSGDENSPSVSEEDDDWDNWDEEEDDDALLMSATQFINSIAAEFPEKSSTISESITSTKNDIVSNRGHVSLFLAWTLRKRNRISLQTVINEMPASYKTALNKLLH